MRSRSLVSASRLLLWILVAGTTLSCVNHRPSSAGSWRDDSADQFQTLVFGLCEDYPEESRSMAAARRDLEVVATNGTPVLRIAFGWDAMEPERGKYDWSFWDEFVRVATDEQGIRLIPYICYTPRWASTSDADDFWQHPPRDVEDFARFIRVIVNRYKDRIHSWELWNEPDNPAYWAGSVEQFAKLLSAGARAVKEADPRAKVVFGGLAWNLEFLDEVLTDKEAMQHVDVVNLHNYFETWSSEPVEYLPDYIGRARDILRQRGFTQPIWMAELGYSSFRRDAFVSGQYQARFRHEHTDEFQASALVRMMTLVAASGQVELAAWYRVNDLPETQEVIGDVNNRHLGVLDRKGAPKPALHALRFFDSVFGNGFRCIDAQVRVSSPIEPRSRVHAFALPGGRLVVVAWLQNYVPGLEARGTGDTRDLRRATISVKLPFANGEARLFDDVGTLLGRVNPKRHGVLPIDVTADKVTIAIIDPVRTP